MLEKLVRPKLENTVVQHIVDFLNDNSGLTPNQITLIGFLSGASVVIWLYLGWTWFAVCALLFSGLADVVDGALARNRNHVSAAGAMFDIISDRAVEFAIIFGLYLQDPTGRGIYCLIMLGSVLLCVTAVLVVGALSNQVSDRDFYYSPGLIERPEAFAFFIAMILLPGLFVLIAWLFIGLTLLTTVIRVTEFKQQDTLGF